VLVNLLSNAVKYTRPRPLPRIEVGARRENGAVILHVRDNGVGFDMTYAEKLFGVFNRLHRADEFPGVGVGLALTRRIVLRHGGRVWAESAADGGAVFHFALPAAPARRTA
jgi:signal transduction histidine kinase